MNPSTIQDLFKLGMKRTLPPVLQGPPGDFLTLNLGCGRSEIPGAINLDLPDWNANTDPIPAGNGTVGTIHAYHFLEHIADPIGMLREFQRVLAPGGVANIVVPYYSSLIQAQDLTHRHSFCEETWRQLFQNNTYYEGETKRGWELQISLNLIIGIAQRNVILLTQLYKPDQA